MRKTKNIYRRKVKRIIDIEKEIKRKKATTRNSDGQKVNKLVNGSDAIVITIKPNNTNNTNMHSTIIFVVISLFNRSSDDRLCYDNDEQHQHLRS